MSSVRSAPPLTLKLMPSRRLLVAMGAGHLLALTSLGVLTLPLKMTVPLGILISVSLVIGYIRHGRSPSPWFIDQLCWSADGQWTLRTANAQERPARLLGSYVHPGLIVLSFALGRWRRRSVVLLPDSADPEAIRRLRVRLGREALADRS